MRGVGSSDTPAIDLEFDRNQVQGGNLIAVSTEFKGKHLFQFGVGRIKDNLLGENPPKPAIHSEIRRQATAARLGVWINSLLAIADQESTFHPFIGYVPGAKPDEGFTAARDTRRFMATQRRAQEVAWHALATAACHRS